MKTEDDKEVVDKSELKPPDVEVKPSSTIDLPDSTLTVTADDVALHPVRLPEDLALQQTVRDLLTEANDSEEPFDDDDEEEGEDFVDENNPTLEELLTKFNLPLNSSEGVNNEGAVNSSEVPKDQLHTFRLNKKSNNKGSGGEEQAHYLFIRKKNLESIQCTGCVRAYKPSTRIDTLIRHLNKKHHFQPMEKSYSKTFLVPQTPELPIKSNKTEQKSLLEAAIVRWILSDNLSLSSLETPAFLNLLKHIAPGAVLPNRDRLREIFQQLLQSNTQYQQGQVDPLQPMSTGLEILENGIPKKVNKRRNNKKGEEGRAKRNKYNTELQFISYKH